MVNLLEHSKRWQHALALWLLAGTWCAKQLTDGELPAVIVTRLGFAKSDADTLVDVGLWERTDRGYLFHDWKARNPTREQVETKREKNRNKVSNWRDNHPRNQVTGEARNQSGDPPPVLSRPIPSQEEAAAAALPDLPLQAEDVSQAWHRALTRPNGGDPLTLHAVHRWRADYETVATVLNGLPSANRAVALQAVCEWFWLAESGPVQSGRIKRGNANPGHLAKRISTDLHSANEWFQTLDRGDAAQ